MRVSWHIRSAEIVWIILHPRFACKRSIIWCWTCFEKYVCNSDLRRNSNFSWNITCSWPEWHTLNQRRFHSKYRTNQLWQQTEHNKPKRFMSFTFLNANSISISYREPHLKGGVSLWNHVVKWDYNSSSIRQSTSITWISINLSITITKTMKTHKNVSETSAD